MSKQKEVFLLIRSLSMPEKKYFKQYVSRFRQSSNRHCILLFDEINKGKAADETGLIHKLPAGTARHLPVYLNQLNELLLDSIQAFHAGKSIDEQIRDLITKAELLNGRALSDIAAKILLRARKVALKYEKHRLLLDIINTQRKVYEAQQFRDTREEDLVRLQQEELAIIECLRVENLLITSNNELLFLFRTRGAVRDDKDAEQYNRIARSMMNRSEKLTSFRINLLYTAFSVNYYRGIQDYGKAYESLVANNTLFRESPHMIRDYPRPYINSYTGRMSVCLSLKKYNEIDTVIDQLKQTLAENTRWIGTDLIFFSEMNMLLHKFVAVLHTGQFEKAEELLQPVNRFMQEHKEKISPFFQLQFYFLNSVFYFSTGRYTEALKDLLNIRDAIKTHLFQQIFTMSRILMLIIYYEKNDMDLLYYEVRSAYRYLIRIQRFYLFEKMLLDFIRLKMRAIQTRSDELTAFRELHGELARIAEIPYEKGFVYYFDIISWLESKIENRPLEKILKEKALPLS